MKNIIIILLLALLLASSFGMEAQVHEPEHHQGSDQFQNQHVEQVPPEEGMNEKEIAEHLKVADENKDGHISFEQHQKYFKKHVIQEQTQDWEEYIRDFFTYLDSDGDKMVTVEQYKNFFLSPPEADIDEEHHGQQPLEGEHNEEYHEVTDEQYINAEHAHHEIPHEQHEEEL